MYPISHPNPKRYDLKPCLLLVVVAFTIRLFWALITPSLPHGDFNDFDIIINNIVNGRGFSFGGHLTAFRAPGYLFFMAAIRNIFGDWFRVAYIANAFLGAWMVYLAYQFSRLVFSKKIALAAAALTAFTPSLIVYTGTLAVENLSNPLFLLCSLWFFYGLKRGGWHYFSLAGLMLGALVLTRPNYLLLPVAWFVYLVIIERNLWRNVVRVAMVMGIAIITFSPWTIRNYKVFNAFVPLSSNGGFNLLISFDEQSTGEYTEAVLPNAYGNEWDWTTYRVKNDSRDELQLQADATASAITFIRENPIDALKLVPFKLYYLFRDDTSGVKINFITVAYETPDWLWKSLRLIAQAYYMITVGTALLAVHFRSKLSAEHWILLIPILYFVALHSIFFGTDRFHLQLLPLFYAYSAFAAVHVVAQAKELKHVLACFPAFNLGPL